MASPLLRGARCICVEISQLLQVLFGDTCLPLSCTVMSRPGITAAPDGAWMPECSLSSGQQDRSEHGAAGQEPARGCRTGASQGLQDRSEHGAAEPVATVGTMEGLPWAAGAWVSRPRFE